jgi:fructose-1,6-bisphosphatase/inositol monophosphatase family enzyme
MTPDPVLSRMLAPRSRDLEILFRISASAHGAFERADASPHRADIVGMGADGSPTEEIDRAAENQILAMLDAEGVDWNLLSEEIGLVRRGGDRTLVADPIDGSHNALRRLPASAISLALGTDTLGSIELGVVHELATGTTYWAERGRGAFRDGHPIRVRPWEPRSELVLLNLGRHATPRVAAWASRARRVRSLGCASIEMSLVGQGSADAYLFENDVPERNLRVTDIAAAYRILLEAGGGIGDAMLQPVESLPLALKHHTSVFAWGDRRFTEHVRDEGML